MNRELLTEQPSPKPPTPTPEIEAWANLLRAHAATTRRFNAELVTGHGLTLNDYEVLLHLAHAPGRRLRRVDLADRILLTPSGITRLLEGLERCGYVERASCESDARVTYAQLTRDGFEKLRAAAATHVEGIRAYFAERFSVAELKSLRALLERLPLEAARDTDCAP
jgi:DNA-binding MarR family transcriptional regulator